MYYSELAMELYPAQSFPLYVLALSLFQEGQLERALAELDNLEPMVQHNRLRKTEATVLRAKCLAVLKRMEEAEQLWSKELSDDPQHVVALEYAAYLSEQQKNIPAELMDKVFRSGFFDSANQSYLAARIYYFRKDFRKAKEMIDAGLSFPTSRTAAYRKLAAEIYSSSGDPARSEQFLLEARQWEEKPGDYPAIQGSPKFK
ncbi:MAG TPA: hypothetical protein VFX48_06725 [Saprospiraceae bacterium]|nr:hypothetical protein [Saprospiraceae bacterium]